MRKKQRSWVRWEVASSAGNQGGSWRCDSISNPIPVPWSEEVCCHHCLLTFSGGSGKWVGNRATMIHFPPPCLNWNRRNAGGGGSRICRCFRHQFVLDLVQYILAIDAEILLHKKHSSYIETDSRVANLSPALSWFTRGFPLSRNGQITKPHVGRTSGIAFLWIPTSWIESSKNNMM